MSVSLTPPGQEGVWHIPPPRHCHTHSQSCYSPPGGLSSLSLRQDSVGGMVGGESGAMFCVGVLHPPPHLTQQLKLHQQPGQR